MATVKVTPEMVAAAMREVDWEAQDALTDAEIAGRVAEDPDAAPVLSAAEVRAVRVRHARRQAVLGAFVHKPQSQ